MTFVSSTNHPHKPIIKSFCSANSPNGAWQSATLLVVASFHNRCCNNKQQAALYPLLGELSWQEVRNCVQKQIQDPIPFDSLQLSFSISLSAHLSGRQSEEKVFSTTQSSWKAFLKWLMVLLPSSSAHHLLPRDIPITHPSLVQFA